MNKEEAITLIKNEIKNYNEWASQILNSLLDKHNCSHPYPGWINKDKEPDKCFCMICGKNLDISQVHYTWNRFNANEKMEEAFNVLKNETNLNYENEIAKLKELLKKFHIESVNIDINGLGLCISHRLSSDGINVIKYRKGKMVMV